MTRSSPCARSNLTEREIKLLVVGAEAARAAIVAAGAVSLRRRRLQHDELFDTTDESLRRRDCALRIRTESGHSLLTFKGPAQPGLVKIREEHETSVGDGGVLATMLEALGLSVAFRYQKYREEFAAADVIIAIDETPIGTFIEIEGSEAGILAMTRLLGRSADDFILDSYRTLFMAHRQQVGLAATDMLFAAEVLSNGE
jgi:adenylate cyclase class 2